MNTKDVILFVFDTLENFRISNKNLGSEGSAFKKIICIEDALEFENQFSKLSETDLAFMVVHVFYTDSINGLKRFVASMISKKYPRLGFMYISEGDSKSINKQMIDADIKNEQVFKYHQVQSYLEDERTPVYRKGEIINFTSNNMGSTIEKVPMNSFNNNELPACDYVIITALEEDEMEKVLPLVNRIGKIPNSKHLIEYGNSKSNSTKFIAYASQQNSGMIDASILATELLMLFKPKFLIMAGVLGGKPDGVNIGDIIVATKVFTIDRGKITDYGFKPEIESSSIDNSVITAIRRYKSSILSFISGSDPTRSNSLNIHFGSIACVRQVIDAQDYFEINISNKDRKALALEMESYGVTRACELVNDGRTCSLIIKSVMDNTTDKNDNNKSYAAWTSSMLLKYLFENDII